MHTFVSITRFSKEWIAGYQGCVHWYLQSTLHRSFPFPKIHEYTPLTRYPSNMMPIIVRTALSTPNLLTSESNTPSKSSNTPLWSPSRPTISVSLISHYNSMETWWQWIYRSLQIPMERSLYPMTVIGSRHPVEKWWTFRRKITV